MTALVVLACAALTAAVACAMSAGVLLFEADPPPVFWVVLGIATATAAALFAWAVS